MEGKENSQKCIIKINVNTVRAGKKQFNDVKSLHLI